MFVAFLIHFQQGNVFFYLKSVFFTKKSVSLLLAKFACTSLAAKFSV